MKVLKIEPACMRDWVASFCACFTKSGPPYIERIAPEEGSIVRVPTRLRSGLSSGSSAIAVTAISCIRGSIVEMIR